MHHQPEDDLEKMVHEFVTKTNATQDPDVWRRMIAEEAEEVKRALAHLMKEYCDLVYVTVGMHLYDERSDDEVQEDKVLGDALAVMSFLGPRLGWSWINRAFRLVHESNMTKIGPDGEVVRHPDGKIAKGPHYQAPDIYALLFPETHGLTH